MISEKRTAEMLKFVRRTEREKTIDEIQKWVDEHKERMTEGHMIYALEIDRELSRMKRENK